MGLPVAAPAAATAFGAPAASAAVYSSLAASAALPTVASLSAGPIASVGSSMMMNPALLSPASAVRLAGAGGGGGLLAGFTLDAMKPYLYGASVIGQMYSNMQQARFQKSMYDVEQLKLAAATETKRLNAELDSIERLKQLKRIMASNLTRQYGGGVAGLDSSQILNETAQKEYGKDYKLALMNIENQILSGNVQSDIYEATGKQVVNSAALNSAVLLGTAAYQYEQLGGP